jgi:ferredoxin
MTPLAAQQCRDAAQENEPMIVAERKPLAEIQQMLAGRGRVLILACGSCVTVCLTGGERQADMLASQLRLAAKKDGRESFSVDVACITRQCDRESFTDLKTNPADYDAVLSIACGVGVGFMSEQFPQAVVLPGLNTTFYGANTAPGEWKEYCHGCGDCALAWTGGICPMARCAKSLINGACGGTNDGKCEIHSDMDCGWYLIYKKLKDTGRLDELRKMRPPRNWKLDRGDGVRRLTHAEMAAIEE